MDQLNARQLGYLLKIPVEAARRKIITAHCKETSTEPQTWVNGDGKLEYHKDDYPESLAIEVLSRHLRIANLKETVEEITKNFLNRKASRGYILGYPLTVANKKSAKDHVKVSIPTVLKSFLPEATIAEIHRLWKEKYGHHQNLQFD